MEHQKKFTDLNFSEEHLIGEPRHKNGGCYISKAKGCIFVSLAILVAVIVGVAVYFAHPDKGKGVENTTVMTATTAPPLDTTPSGNVDVRLPTDINPFHYNVRFRPDIYLKDPKDFKFTGNVEIFVNVEKNTKMIILHWRDLTIEKNKIKIYDQTTMGEIKVDYGNIEMMDAPTEFLKIPTKDDLIKDNTYRVDISYEGPIKKDLKGIYWSSYENDGGEKVYLLTSQLQATDARKTFPCMDEPALKATFNITIERMSSKHSKSNMLIYNKETLTDGWIADHYETTPTMSTYLLAFLVSDFECVSDKTNTGTLVEICARPPAYNQTMFAMSIAVDMQEWFESYHNVSYPLSKTTHVAVPDFSAGAMENWGLIVYRETALLYDKDTSSASNKQRVAVVVSHELAHQWFGNLVSPAWWDDVWLNEGFASYMELWGIHNVKDFSTWNMEAQFVVEDLQDVMIDDSLVTSHPIYVAVNDPAEIGGLFDGITYSKGASVIRMMKYFLGENTFRWGLSEFLKNKTYESANHTDLFNFLRLQAKKDGKDLDVNAIMGTWIRQMGYPVITFNYTRSESKIYISQEHFRLDQTLKVTVKSDYDYLWKVPISFMTDLSGYPDLDNLNITWLGTKEATIDITGDLKWIIGNVGQTFFYRVNYDETTWNNLIAVLNTSHEVINVTNRAQIIDDSFNLGRSGYIHQRKALQVTEYIVNEVDYTPWYSLSANMGYIRRMLQQTTGKMPLEKYMQKQVTAIYTKLGWNELASDSHLDLRLRTIIISLACRYQVQDCLNKAKSKFSEWMVKVGNNESYSPDPNFAYTVYCYGIAEGGVKEWNFAHQMFKTSNSGAQKSSLLSAMGCSQETWILQRYLQYALAEDVYGIGRQDMRTALVSVARNSLGKHMAWNFFKSNWDIYFERFGDVSFTLSSMVYGLTESFSEEWELSDLKQFVIDNPDQGTGKKQFLQSIESTEANIKWRKKHGEDVITWLQEKSI